MLMLNSTVGYILSMKEHYGLSNTQKAYLNGTKKVSNSSKENTAIMRKAFQAWSIFKPILDSEVLHHSWKYAPFVDRPLPSELVSMKIPETEPIFTFKHFLSSLLKTSKENPTSKEIEKNENS